MPRCEVGESHPGVSQDRILDTRRELVLEPDPGLELIHPGTFPVLGEAAALQVQPGEAECTLRVPPSDPDESVVDPERPRVGLHPSSDLRRNRTQHELAQHHVLDDPMPERRRRRIESPQRGPRDPAARGRRSRPRPRSARCGPLPAGSSGPRRGRRRSATAEAMPRAISRASAAWASALPLSSVCTASSLSAIRCLDPSEPTTPSDRRLRKLVAVGDETLTLRPRSLRPIVKGRFQTADDQARVHPLLHAPQRLWEIPSAPKGHRSMPEERKTT